MQSVTSSAVIPFAFNHSINLPANPGEIGRVGNKKVYDISPVLAQSTKYNVKGKLDIPYYDESEDKLTVAYQDEFVALSSHNGKFASIELTGFLAGALSKISRSLINNAQFNIVDFVVTEMSDSIARFIEHELLVGTPSNLPTLAKSVGLATKKEIEIHKDKIKNPKKHYPNWDEFDEREKKGYIKHWKKEINNFEISIKRKEQELKRRGVHD